MVRMAAADRMMPKSAEKNLLASLLWEWCSSATKVMTSTHVFLLQR